MSQEADPGSGYRRQGGGGTEERCRAIMEVQDELLQQKDALLKDIRVIQKRKIKEMEELYDIKLKKKEFEQELETTKQSVDDVTAKIDAVVGGARSILNIMDIIRQTYE